ARDTTGNSRQHCATRRDTSFKPARRNTHTAEQQFDAIVSAKSPAWATIWNTTSVAAAKPTTRDTTGNTTCAAATNTARNTLFSSEPSAYANGVLIGRNANS